MLSLIFHFRELLLRLIYSILAWILTSIVIFSEIDSVIFALTPSLPSIFVYTSALEILQAKLSISMSLSAYLLFPHWKYVLGLYIRPGLTKSESNLRLRGLLLPWVVLYFNILIIELFVTAMSNYYYRYLPSFSGISSQIFVLLLVSLIMTHIPQIIKHGLNFLGDRVYARYRLIIVVVTAGTACLILPPDGLFAILAMALSLLALETFYFLGKWKDNYWALKTSGSDKLLSAPLLI